MATSITASNSSAPFNGYLLTDSNYTVTQSWTSVGGVSPSMNFKVASPWPSIIQTELYVYSTAITGTSVSSSYITIQGAPDNATWTNLATIASPVVTVTAGAATSAYVSLPPGTPQYIRVSGSSANAPTGSFGATLLF